MYLPGRVVRQARSGLQGPRPRCGGSPVFIFTAGRALIFGENSPVRSVEQVREQSNIFARVVLWDCQQHDPDNLMCPKSLCLNATSALPYRSNLIQTIRVKRIGTQTDAQGNARIHHRDVPCAGEYGD